MKPPEQIQSTALRGEAGMVRLLVIVDGREREFLLARRVALSLATRLVEVLAE